MNEEALTVVADEQLGILAQNLIEARQARGLSEAKVCEAIGISRTALRGLEAGKAGSRIANLAKLLAFYGMPTQLGDIAAPHRDLLGRETRKVIYRR